MGWGVGWEITPLIFWLHISSYSSVGWLPPLLQGHMANLSSTCCLPESPRSFLQCFCLVSHCPACPITQGYSPPGAGLAFAWAECHEVPVTLPKSLWIAALPSSVSTTLPNLVASANLLRVLSLPSFRLLMKTLNSIILSIKLHHW